MRRSLTLSLLVTLGLMGAACSDDLQQDSASESAAVTEPAATEPDTTEPAVTEPAVTEPDTTEPETTEVEPAPAPAAPAPALAPAPAATAPTAAVTPELVCSSDEDYYFSYTNDNDAPVVIDVGAANRLTDADHIESALVPTVFAPGRVFPAFIAQSEDSNVTPTWTLRGPDGTSRTARWTSNVPICTSDEFPEYEPDLAGAPRITSSASVQPFSSPPTEVDLTVAVGIPATSTCADGLESLPPIPWFSAVGGEFAVTPGATWSGTLPLVRGTDSVTGRPALYLESIVAADYVDVCGFDGASSVSWPTSTGYGFSPSEVTLCIEWFEGLLTTRIGECPGIGFPPLPATGGIRLRSTPPV